MMSKHILLSMEKYNRLMNDCQDSEPDKTEKDVLHEKKIDPHSENQSKTILENKSSESELLHSIPIKLKHRASVLLHYLPKSSWNEQGEFVVKGNVVKGSHIADLIRDALTNRTFKPVGYMQFYKHLAELNVPEGTIGSVQRRELFRIHRLGKDTLQPINRNITQPKPKPKPIAKKAKWLVY